MMEITYEEWWGVDAYGKGRKHITVKSDTWKEILDTMNEGRQTILQDELPMHSVPAPSAHAQEVHAPVDMRPGTCADCGAKMKWSEKKSKWYCGALCWKNKQNA